MKITLSLIIITAIVVVLGLVWSIQIAHEANLLGVGQ